MHYHNLLPIGFVFLSKAYHWQDAEDVVTDGRTTEICSAAGTPRRFVITINIIIIIIMKSAWNMHCGWNTPQVYHPHCNCNQPHHHCNHPEHHHCFPLALCLRCFCAFNGSEAALAQQHSCFVIKLSPSWANTRSFLEIQEFKRRYFWPFFFCKVWFDILFNLLHIFAIMMMTLLEFSPLIHTAFIILHESKYFQD